MAVIPQPVPVAEVRVPPRSIQHDLRAIRIIWHRDVIRFLVDRNRIASALITPVLYLFVLGTGLSTVATAGGAGTAYRTSIFPGVLALAVLFPSVFSAGSIVIDREYGFLREMLVAPVRRTALVLGKCFSGATIACLHGVVLFAVAGLVGVPYSAPLMLSLAGELLLLSFALTAFGVMVAAQMSNAQSYVAFVQIFLMPLLFLSGALFPLSGLPVWLRVLTRINPITYAVDPMRRTMFSYLNLPPAARQALSGGATWWGWTVPTWLELVVVAVLGIGMTAVAAKRFNRVR